jgi:hypothetical protein
LQALKALWQNRKKEEMSEEQREKERKEQRENLKYFAACSVV